jgi:hypothetical protein
VPGRGRAPPGPDQPPPPGRRSVARRRRPDPAPPPDRAARTPPHQAPAWPARARRLDRCRNTHDLTVARPADPVTPNTAQAEHPHYAPTEPRGPRRNQCQPLPSGKAVPEACATSASGAQPLSVPPSNHEVEIGRTRSPLVAWSYVADVAARRCRPQAVKARGAQRRGADTVQAAAACIRIGNAVASAR